MKANPFLVPYLPEDISRVEVCSPGELKICKGYAVPPGKILYSGVMKEAEDIAEAVGMKAGLITAESIRHFELICDAAQGADAPVDVLLRLSSGNQFGMSEADICSVLSFAKDKANVRIAGIHYFSGTAKDLRQVGKDIRKIDRAIRNLEDTGFECGLLEYGPGLSAAYFGGSDADCEQKDMELLHETAPIIEELAKRYDLSIELGRFMAAPCGTYETEVKEIKTTDGVNYAIVDGGTHHLKYHGQNMAMKTPPVEHDGNGEKELFTICGSLCTVADVMARDIELEGLKPGDLLSFKRAGAYSVTEGAMMFLSRKTPDICIRSQSTGSTIIRGASESYRYVISDPT